MEEMIKIYGYVEKGLGKVECQDRVLIGDTMLAGGFLEASWEDMKNMVVAVADGVGGYPGGEIASLMAVDGIRMLNRRMSLDTEGITELAKNVNRGILQYGRQNPMLERMATTLTALVMNGDKAISIHIGNCRLCTFRKYLQQITKDQTVVEDMISRGEISREQAKSSEIRNQINACLGGNKEEYIQELRVTEEGFATKDSNIILTSDGIHDYMDEEELEEKLISETEPKKLCEEIARRARENGSEDDISIVIIDRMGKYDR